MIDNYSAKDFVFNTYGVIGISSLLISYFGGEVPTNLFLTYVIYIIVTMGILLLLGIHKQVSDVLHGAYALTCFMIIAFITGLATKHVNTFIAMALVSQFLSIAYTKRRLFILVFVQFLALLSVIIYLSTYWHTSQNWFDTLVMILVMGIFEVFILKFMKLLAFQQRKNDEQELSLNDLLKVLIAKCEEARVATASKSMFLSNMSHEIRTPINAILGMDEMILRESTEDHIIQYADNINNAGHTLLGIINDILDFSKIESGKVVILPDKYETKKLVNDIYNLVALRIKNKHLEFIVNVDENIPSALYGDDLRIKQIILNLLTNALKYTVDGSITFTLTFENFENNNILLKVSVKDTGIGMKEEDLARLTSPYERFDEQKNKGIEGTGLGMSISDMLLSQMDSHMNIESTYGKGSTFSFQIVQGIVDSAPMGPWLTKPAQARTIATPYISKYIAPNACILAVDDTSMNLMVIQGLLRQTKIQIDTCKSGEECLDALTKKHYDLILLDHRMPGMDGVETLHQLRFLGGSNVNIPCIALTANVMSGAKEYYISEGFSDFLAKPVSGPALEAMVKKYLPKNLIKELDAASGHDESAGISACGSEDVYLQVVTEFVNTADSKIVELENYCAQNDFENFTIKVHALKSVARFVGALELSNEAAYLEKCGNDGNYSEISQKKDSLFTHYKETATKLSDKYKIFKETKALPLINENELTELFMALSEFAKAFDFDQVDAMFNKLNEYQLPENLSDTYKELKEAIYDIDQARIVDITDTFLANQQN